MKNKIKNRLQVDRDCIKGTLPNMENTWPRHKETLCSLALKSSAGSLFVSKYINK